MTAPSDLTRGAPWLGRTPRQWQPDAVSRCLASMRARRADVLSVATGCGKSYAQAEVAASIVTSPRWAGGPVVVSVPTEDLVKQMHVTMDNRLPGRVGMYYGRRKQPRSDVIVTCAPSLGSLADALLLAKRRPVAWIADECHRGLASDQRLADIARLDPMTRCGWTATPWRTDAPIPGWQDLIMSYRLADAARDGCVLWPEVHTIASLGLGALHRTVTADDGLLAMLAARPPEGPGIVSAYDIPDAEAYAERLTAAGIPAQAIHSKLPSSGRAALLEELRTGKLGALVHVRLLVEGVDLPWLDWLGARVERSALGQVQEVGRILRTHSGKLAAHVYDPLDAGLIESFSTPARLGDLEERAATEARTVIAAERSRVIPLSEARVGAAHFARLLWESATRAGLPVAPTMSDRDRQREESSDKQRAALRKYASGRLYVPAPARDGVRALCEAPDAIDHGTASRLLSVLVELGRRRYETARGDWSRAWQWPESIEVPALDGDVIKAIAATQVAAPQSAAATMDCHL